MDEEWPIGTAFRMYYKRDEFLHPIIIESRTVYNDVSVTRWKHWKRETSNLPDSFKTVYEAVATIERVYGPIMHTGFSNNLYTFEVDESFQIRFIDINNQFDDEYPDKEPQKQENPWQIDFAKEL